MNLPNESSAIGFLPERRSVWKRMVQRIGKTLIALRYRRFSPDSEPDRVVRVAGLRLQLLRGVFNPSMHFTSSVFARYLMRRGVALAGTSVLDLGTGSGVLAVAAALAGAGAVVATDVNPEAVRCATLNARRYGLEERISVREGDMFSAVHGEGFDLVLCNPPYFRGEPKNMAERAFYGGPAFDWLRRFGTELHTHIKPGGCAYISVGDAADIGAILRLLAARGWLCRQVDQRDRIVETVYLFRLTEVPNYDKEQG